MDTVERSAIVNEKDARRRDDDVEAVREKDFVGSAPGKYLLRLGIVFQIW
jgi:hypothetical protein